VELDLDPVLFCLQQRRSSAYDSETELKLSILSVRFALLALVRLL
jgi:hypothetical protein